MPAGGKKKPAKPLSGNGFKRTADLNIEDLKKLVVPSEAGAANLFGRWSGGIISAVIMRLSNDNLHVADCNLLLQGNLFADANKLVNAAGFWPDAPNLTLVLEKLDCSIFKFAGGTTSMLVDSTLVPHHYIKDGTALTQEQVEELGIRGFTIRIYNNPSSATRLKLTCAVYPLPSDELVFTHPLAVDPRFPGLKLFSHEVDIHPRSDTLLKKSWGSPIAPAILQGQEFDSDQPSSTEILHALSKTMINSCKPEIKANFETLNQRWGELKEGSSQLKTIEADLVWPEPANLTPVVG